MLTHDQRTASHIEANRLSRDVLDLGLEGAMSLQQNCWTGRDLNALQGPPLATDHGSPPTSNRAARAAGWDDGPSAPAQAEMAHDLGNLLQVIASAVGLIDRRLEQGSRAELRPLTQGALASVSRAAALSRQMLDITRATDRPEILCLTRTLNSIADLICLMAGPLIQVRFDLRDDLPRSISDAMGLENVILNFVVNARDAMPDGGLLTIETYACRGPLGTGLEPVDQAVLCVTDSGCGMSPEILRQAFEPFFSTKPKERGSGIGLASARAFASRFGGIVEIESAVGLGTSVTLRMPSCEP